MSDNETVLEQNNEGDTIGGDNQAECTAPAEECEQGEPELSEEEIIQFNQNMSELIASDIREWDNYVEAAMGSDYTKNPFSDGFETVTGVTPAIFNSVLGVNTEIGKILSEIEQSQAQQRHPDFGVIADNAGDVMWYLAKFEDEHSGAIATENIAINMTQPIAELRKEAADALDHIKNVMNGRMALNLDYIKSCMSNVYTLTRHVIFMVETDPVTVRANNLNKIQTKYVESPLENAPARMVVSSSNLEAATYHNESQTATIEFKNGTAYRYNDVTIEQFNALVESESVGKHFNSVFKPEHPNFEKIAG